MVKRVGIAGVIGVLLVGGILVGAWMSRQGVPQQPPQPAPTTVMQGAPAQARPNPSPEPTVGDPAPVRDPQMEEAKVSAFLRITGDAGATHQRVADVIADSGFDARKRVFVHAAVQDYLDNLATYRDQVAAGEMQERDLVFNDEEARDALDDTLRQRLQDDTDRVLDAL